MSRILSKKFVDNKAVQGLFGLLVVALASLIFAHRYAPAFQIPNFYAEDGTIFLNNALHQGFIHSLFTGFDGYLVVGQYLLANLTVFIYQLFDLHFYQLPHLLAIVSSGFLGLTVALPFLLFRKELGLLKSLTLVLLGALVPLPTADFAVIGTLGNIKFAFLYWAVLFIIYRQIHSQNKHKAIFADVMIVGCLLTNVPVFLLLPFIIWPYRQVIAKSIKKRNIRDLLKPQIISAFLVLAFASAYVTAILIKGIPELPGYLDTPYHWDATIKIIYRVTLYTWLFPITSTMRNLVVIILLGSFVYYAIKKPQNRYIIILSLWAIFVATFSFVFKRPGVSDSFTTYQLIYTSPDQFFYAQNLVFLFASLWIVDLPRKIGKQSVVFVIAVATFILWSYTYSGSFGLNKVNYQNIGTAKLDIQTLCASKPSGNINIPLYPNGNWHWLVPSKEACR